MVLKQKGTTVTYRCPKCGSWVTSLVGVFSLTADMLRLKCPCGESEMDILHTKEKKVRLSVPCFLCPQPHSYTVSAPLFYDKELFALPCPYSGVDISFLGKEETVSAATKTADNELTEMLGETEYDALSAARDTEEHPVFSDMQILDIVNFVVRDLEEAGEISCYCPESGDYSVEVTPDGVLVRCNGCGANKVVPVTSTLSANAFLHCTHLDLAGEETKS